MTTDQHQDRAEPLRVGIVGCGGRGKAHAEGYAANPETQIVACVDPVTESRTAFAGEFGVAAEYSDYREMLGAEQLDIVSVCTWPHMHRPMVEAAAKTSGVRAIHAEKPMAPTWGDARAMHDVCVANDTILTLCHQRRFGDTFRTARKLLHDCAIGDLQRVEGTCPNLFDWGTHWFDMMFFFNGESPAQWVMGQIDVASESSVFGVDLETSGLSLTRFENGVEGLMATGEASHVRLQVRLVGRDGVIEIEGGEPLRMSSGGKWETPPLSEGVPAEQHTIESVRDLVACIASGEEPELSSHKALRATELIFATYESSRRRSRIELPLRTDDSALISMLAENQIVPGAQS
jgi:predicted dehydrogenase